MKIDGEEEIVCMGIFILLYNLIFDVYIINYFEKGGCGKSSIIFNWKDVSYNVR